jgi:Protein of unknwon function (DUF3310)
MEDMVNSPSHYASGGIECIESIEASLTTEAFCGYLKGNIQKYLWRYENKQHPLQDLQKAEWYLKRLIQLIASCEKHGS